MNKLFMGLKNKGYLKPAGLFVSFIIVILIIISGCDSPFQGSDDYDFIIKDTTVPLCRKYACYFPIGAAVDSESYKDKHVYLLKKHFNSIVCENEMKWESLQPEKGVFDYETADKIVKFARANNMLVRGHCLVWHSQTPDWVFSESPSKEVLIETMRTHITNVVGHFKGKVYAWDVVNEAIVGYKNGWDVGEDLTPVVSWDYRNSTWYQVCGEDYIIEAFKAAREADPGAKLFYNDYWNYLDDKREAIKTKIIAKLAEEDLIDGVGLQCHLNIDVAQEKEYNQTVYQTVENLEKEIQDYAGIKTKSGRNLDVHITELDISIYLRDYSSSDESKWFTEEVLNEELSNKLAARYDVFFDMFRRNSNIIQNVTFWGIADDNTWLSEFSSGRPDHPLLFDRNLMAKKAFFAITDF